MSPASELAGATETRGCRALWAENEKTPTREGEGDGNALRGACPAPLRWGLAPVAPAVGAMSCERQASNSAT